MRDLDLDTVAENATEALLALAPRLVGDAVRARDAEDFSTACRERGIAALLLDADATTLHRELCRSGRALTHALPRIAPNEQTTSKARGFYDALAAGDLACAQRISAIARGSWNPDNEYEEDFLFLRLLMSRLFLDASDAACAEFFARWETVIGPVDDVRLPLARALVTRDGAAYGQALDLVLASERRSAAARRARGSLSTATDATEARVSIEGIALTRVGRALGFTLPDDSWGVPSIALVERPPAFTGDGWQSI
jgi:hypothetical protein